MSSWEHNSTQNSPIHKYQELDHGHNLFLGGGVNILPSIVVCFFFSFNTLNISFHSFCLHGFWEVSCNSYPCSSTAVFLPAIFQDFLYLWSSAFWILFLSIYFFGIYPARCSPASVLWMCGLVLVINFGKFSCIITSNICFCSVLFLFLVFQSLIWNATWNCPQILGCAVLCYSFPFLSAFQFVKFLLTYISLLIVSSAMSNLLMSPWKACFI